MTLKHFFEAFHLVFGVAVASWVVEWILLKESNGISQKNRASYRIIKILSFAYLAFMMFYFIALTVRFERFDLEFGCLVGLVACAFGYLNGFIEVRPCWNGLKICMVEEALVSESRLYGSVSGTILSLFVLIMPLSFLCSVYYDKNGQYIFDILRNDVPAYEKKLKSLWINNKTNRGFVKLSHPDPLLPNSPIEAAAMAGNFDLFEKLVDRGAGPWQQTEMDCLHGESYNSTPLLAATGHGFEVVMSKRRSLFEYFKEKKSGEADGSRRVLGIVPISPSERIEISKAIISHADENPKSPISFVCGEAVARSRKSFEGWRENYGYIPVPAPLSIDEIDDLILYARGKKNSTAVKILMELKKEVGCPE